MLLACLLACLLAEGESAALASRCLQATVSMSPVGLLSSACHLAAHLNLELPHIAGDALLLRGMQELGLPQVNCHTAVHKASCVDMRSLSAAGSCCTHSPSDKEPVAGPAG